jgi:hypothetical protein
LPTPNKHDHSPTANSGDDATNSLRTPHEATDFRLFEKAMAKFNAGRFAEAEEVFEQLMKSSDIALMDAARQRQRMCERR